MAVTDGMWRYFRLKNADPEPVLAVCAAPGSSRDTGDPYSLPFCSFGPNGVLPCTLPRRAGCARYRQRRPERTPLYRVVQGHLETYLALAQEGQGERVAQYVEGEFRRYLRCGILAHGFARARCGDCGHDFLVAFSCKGRALCPSCNARRMAEVAAHLVDQIFPPLPVRQWVLSVPKRLRYFLRAATRRR